MARYLREGEGAPTEEIKQVQAKLMWVIRFFEEKALILQSIESPIFITFLDQYTMNWRLNMSFDETDEDGERLIGIFIQSLNHHHFRLSVQYSVLDVNNNKEVNICPTTDFTSETGFYGFEYFIKKQALLALKNLNLLNEGKLTVICTLATNQYIDVKNRKSYEQLEQSLRFEESEHSLNFLRGGTLSDVVFSVEGKKIHAHKSILANRSTVFQAMFTHDMSEARDNSVVVADVPYSAMYDLFIFIYSGVVPAYSKEQYKNYLELLIAADKYDIKKLKLDCEKKLLNILEIDNVFDTLILAERHNALILTDRAIQFIASNADQIVESGAFKEFGKLPNELSAEVFRGLVIKRRRTYNF